MDTPFLDAVTPTTSETPLPPAPTVTFVDSSRVGAAPLYAIPTEGPPAPQPPKTAGPPLAPGADAGVHGQFIRVLGPVLVREATARNPGVAATFAAEVARTDPATVNTAALLTAIDTLFPCP